MLSALALPERSRQVCPHYTTERLCQVYVYLKHMVQYIPSGGLLKGIPLSGLMLCSAGRAAAGPCVTNISYDDYKVYCIR